MVAQVADRVAVLHVDDSPAERYRRRKALEGAGYSVVDAATGHDARAAFLTARADLVLLDVRLPDTTGFDLCRELKRTAELAAHDTAVVLISSFFHDAEYRVQGLQSGADACLSEPVADTELILTIERLALRVQQLKAARANARLLDAVFDYIPEGITVADAPDVTIRRVSRFGAQLAGRPDRELVNAPAAAHPVQWAIFHKDGVTPARPEELPLTRAVTTGAIVTDEEWILRRPDGTDLTILCNAGPILDPEGRVKSGVIAWRDITARKQVEAELRSASEHLRNADHAKNDLLATVAHEMRQPLHAALAAIAVMEARPDAARGSRARENVKRQLHKIARLVEDLLDTTRIVRREVAFNFQRCDLHDVLRASVETITAAAQQGAVDLVVDVPSAAVWIQSDANRLQQVFVNILSNAIRYTPRGGSVAITSICSADEVSVRVADTGIGIPPDRLPHVFDLFVRGSTSPGLGVGLTVSKALVEAHSGRIEISSSGPGHGTLVVVTLPLG